MDVFIGLFDNVVAFFAMVSLTVIWTTSLKSNKKYYRYVMGVGLSFMAIFIMNNSVYVGDGLYIDARYAVPIIAVVFFGVLPGLMVTVTIILARIYILGGAGVNVGVSFAVIQFVIAYFYKIYYYDKNDSDSIRVSSLKLAGLSLFMQLILLSLPLVFLPLETALSAIKGNAAYLLIIYPVIVYFFSVIVEYRKDYNIRVQEGQLRDQFLSTILKRSLNPIAIIEKTGTILHLNEAWKIQSGFDCSDYENIIQWFEDTEGPLNGSVDEVGKAFDEYLRIDYIIHSNDGRKVIWNIEQKEAGELPNGKLFYVLIGKDITEHMEYQEKLLDMSYHDFLTGLYNRRYFYEVFENRKEKFKDAVVLYGDMNDLKSVNDYYGHFKGDDAILLCAKILNKHFSSNSTLFRFGGDEFLIVAENTTKEDCIDKISKINTELENYNFGKIKIGISLGLHELKPDQDLSVAVMKAESRMYEYKIFESSSARSGAIELILTMLFEKDPETERHSKRVQKICNTFGKHLDLSSSQSSLLSRSALMHDIGKILIPTNILLSVHKLSEQEFETIRNHSFLGHRILSRKSQFKDIAEIVLTHHERYDGHGYPNQLSGEEIPFIARILHIADSFEAMTSVRPYAKKKTYEEAKIELIKCRGTQFDKELVNKFVEIIDEIPSE